MKKLWKRTDSYAETVKNIQASGETHRSTTANKDFRSIMKEARNEELAEKSEMKLRLFNLIVHAVNEVNSVDKDEEIMIDEVFATSLLETFKGPNNIPIRFQNWKRRFGENEAY